MGTKLRINYSLETYFSLFIFILQQSQIIVNYYRRIAASDVPDIKRSRST